MGAGVGLGASAIAQDVAWSAHDDRLAVDAVIVLDVSESMQGLIDSARLKLWEIVNDLALSEPAPRLRVALISYGHPDHDARAGWVRVEAPLSPDLDLVSQRLFELESEGGTEYVARAVRIALDRLSWSESRDALKLVFVAGNERADQDPQVRMEDVGADAVTRSVLVSAIFCGRGEDEAAQSWRDLARFADGSFATIDQRAGTIAVKTPFDADLAELSAELNETFVPLGEEGRKRVENLAGQDRNAEKMSPSAAATRAATKSSPLFSSGWDLVDAVESGEVRVVDVARDDLPEDLREMSPSELEIYVDTMGARREDLRRKIEDLAEQRRQFLGARANAGAKPAGESRAFDAVVRGVLRERLRERGVTPAGR